MSNLEDKPSWPEGPSALSGPCDKHSPAPSGVEEMIAAFETPGALCHFVHVVVVRRSPGAKTGNLQTRD